MSCASPVLLLVFNRPETTQRVFEAVRQARPPRLYVAADGPRPSRPQEAAVCEDVRRIATAVDWPCEVRTLFRTENLGCRKAVSSAITWFFDHEPEGIVLEDDCLPEPTFFPYCDELLARYRDDARVAMVSGDNFVSSAWRPDGASYYFSRYAHIWGWATWRRAWAHYDAPMARWKAMESRADWLMSICCGNRAAAAHWQACFDAVAEGRIDTWDYQWQFTCWHQRAATCLPATNLIRNIGFGAGATHTHDAESRLANMATAPLAFPLRHPTGVRESAEADAWTEQHVFRSSDRAAGLLGRLKRLLRRILR